MVSAVSLIGTAFAVGGSYFAVDSLRDILIAKTINTSYATRIVIASAAAFAGLMVISKDSASKASKQTKTQLGKQLISAEENDPSDMTCHYCEKDGSKRGGLITWPSGLAVCEMCFDEEQYDAEGKTRGYSLDRFTKQKRPSGDSFRRRGRRSAISSLFSADSGSTIYMIETEYHNWDNWQNDCISRDSFGPYATEAGAKEALKEMMEDEAERWTQHDDLRDLDTNEPMFTFGLELDEYGNLEIKPSGMSLDDFTQKHTKTEHKGGRAFDGMTYSGVVVAKQMKAADSDDDDDDSSLVPDREPSRGAPDLWFAEIYEAECASCDTTHGFDFICVTCGLCLDCDPCSHDSRARGPFTDKDAEGDDDDNPYCHLYEKTQRWTDGRYRCGGRKGHAGRCSAWSRSGSGKQSFDGYPPCEHIKTGQTDCGCILGDGVDDSIGARLANHPLFEKKKSAEESVAVGTKFTCDCGAKCTVDADTEIAYGPGGYDLRCGRNDDCRGDEKVLGAEELPHFYGNCDECKKPMMVGTKVTDRHGVTGQIKPSKICQECDHVVCGSCHPRVKVCPHCEESFGAEVFEAFSLSDRPVSVKFGPGTSGNAKMKATFTDASGDTKTTQFGYKGMSDFTKHKDEGRRSSYLARHGSKGQNQNWKDPTTAGALSRYVLWEKTSLPGAKSAFKKRFNLRAEEIDTEDSYIGYQVSPFITETDRMAAWVYEPVYSDEDAL